MSIERMHSRAPRVARPRVIIVGGGFAGLWATRALRHDAVDITLIDRTNHHLFQPLLYQVATASLSPADIAAPLRHILRDQSNVDVVLGEVVDVQPGSCTVALADGRQQRGDFLVLATGAQHAYFGHDEWGQHAPGLKTLRDALDIRERILLAFERAEFAADFKECAGWLHFAVVGGGPTGVELAGALAEISRQTLALEFRHFDPARAVVRLIEAGPDVLPSFSAPSRERARRQLEALGVEVVTGARVTGVDALGYTLDGVRIPARTVLWAAGVVSSPLGRLLDSPVDVAGRVQVDPDLSVAGHPNVFVVGDLAAVSRPDGRPVPALASAAKQMGVHAARGIRARLAGKAAPRFRYRHHGSLATIGRLAAVVEVPYLRLSGSLAWWTWLLAHIYFLIGFRNRAAVFFNWTVEYCTADRPARLISPRKSSTTPPISGGQFDA